MLLNTCGSHNNGGMADRCKIHSTTNQYGGGDRDFIIECEKDGGLGFAHAQIKRNEVAKSCKIEWFGLTYKPPHASSTRWLQFMRNPAIRANREITKQRSGFGKMAYEALEDHAKNTLKCSEFWGQPIDDDAIAFWTSMGFTCKPDSTGDEPCWRVRKDLT